MSQTDAILRDLRKGKRVTPISQHIAATFRPQAERRAA
jgi:hypothetical protein